MSKFLKFIVHFAVICTIVCVLGLALPPFFGVRTVIMDSTDKATNLPLGSVTYAIPVRTEEVTAALFRMGATSGFRMNLYRKMAKPTNTIL